MLLTQRNVLRITNYWNQNWRTHFRNNLNISILESCLTCTHFLFIKDCIYMEKEIIICHYRQNCSLLKMQFLIAFSFLNEKGILRIIFMKARSWLQNMRNIFTQKMHFECLDIASNFFHNFPESFKSFSCHANWPYSSKKVNQDSVLLLSF